MEVNYNKSDEEESVSLGPAGLMSADDASILSQQYNDTSIPDPSFLSPQRNVHAMGFLSLSSIPAVESSNPPHIHLSPESDSFRPDILMSTINTNKQPVLTSDDELSISMGPLPNFEPIQSEENHSFDCNNPQTSLAANIQRFSQKQNQFTPSVTSAVVPSLAVALGSKSIQTEEFKCLKCEELHISYNIKLLDVATEFQRQYANQFQMAEQHAKALEESQQQIKDLREQLDAADKQLKANRAFLEQQAIEREQEREDANQQHNKLSATLAEKEKEFERERMSSSQLTADVQHLQEALAEKDKLIQDQSSTLQRMEQQIHVLRMNQADLAEENSSLQTVLDVKDKLLKAQAEQIAALQNELENHLYSQSESERENENVPLAEKSHEGTRNVADHSLSGTTADVPTLFDELQQMIIRLLHKVDSNTRFLEAAQLTKQQKISNHLLSPRNFVTPSTSTEDISIKDRNQTALDNLRDCSPSPPAIIGQNDPEMALNFLQQLDGKLAALSRIEEAACKRIADLEVELQRVAHSEKRSASKASELEQQYQQHQLIMKEIEAEKHEMQMEHTELLKRISSLENRLEEQRRSAALGASQNLHAEKCRVLSEEKQQLCLIVQEKEESMVRMKEQISELHQRIEKLMKTIQLKEQESSSASSAFASSSSRQSEGSVERLRDAQHQDGSLTWSKLNVQNTPIALSPIYQPQQKQQTRDIPQSFLVELENLTSKLMKCENERQALEDQLASNNNELAQLDSLEQRNATLEAILDRTEQEKKELEERCLSLEKELNQSLEKLKGFEVLQRRRESLEKKLEKQTAITDELETARQSYSEMKKELVDQKMASLAAMEELKKRCADLETALDGRKNLAQEYETLRRKCSELEAESTAHRGTIANWEALQQRCTSLQDELIKQQHVNKQQSLDFQAQLQIKDQAVNDLHTKLKTSDRVKSQVEKALQQLQLEVEAIKKAQQIRQKQVQVIATRESSTLLEGPAAPPDLLAPSFVEFLGSSTSSRCSSRTSSSSLSSLTAIGYRATESRTLHDFSLPNSMVGKKVLKNVQHEGEQLLAFGKQLLELQQKMAQQQQGQKNTSSSGNGNVDSEDLETTLKPDGEGFEASSTNTAALVELQNKVELLETELAMERLLLQDQRAANSRQQQQMMQLMAIQREQRNQHLVTTQEPHRSSSSLSMQAQRSSSLQHGYSGKFLQYQAMKLESIRKNLMYQKKFLVKVVKELEPDEFRRAENRSVGKPFRRFRSVVFALIAVTRMRFIQAHWRHRRKMIESQPPA